MIVRSGLISAMVAASALLSEPLRALAASPVDCPTAVVPESPAGPALLVVAALGVVSIVAWRRRGLSAAILSTLTMVALCGAVLGTVVAGAATAGCSTDPVSGGGGVLAANTTTPFTGANIPWMTAAVLILAGSLVSWVARGRRRSRQD